MENDLPAAVTVPATAVFVAVAGYAAWPLSSDGLAWEVQTALFDLLGVAALGVILVICIVLGGAFAYLTGVKLLSFGATGFVVYLVGMYYINVSVSPDSPVHLLIYGAILAALFAGVVAVRLWENGRILDD